MLPERYWRLVWNRAWQDTAKMTGGLPALPLLAVIALLPIAVKAWALPVTASPLALFDWQGLSGAMFIVLIFVLHFVAAPAALHAEQKRDHESLVAKLKAESDAAVGARDATIQALQEQLAPKLSFVFGTGPPFEMQTMSHDPDVHWQRFRIGVKNDKGATIDHVGVDLVEIRPQYLEEIIQLPLPMLPMHGLQTPLDPGPPRMFDVVSRGYYRQVPHPSFQGNGDAIEICHAVEHLRALFVPLQRLELTLEAHGANVPSRRQRVAVGYDVAAGRHGPLSFSLLPTPQ